MSIFSAQSDELRSMAASVGLAIPQAATLMMGSADTIDRLDAENKMLRELANIGEYAAKECSELAEQNAKLRELARGLGQCAQGVNCEDCLLYDLSEPDHCREERLSRELGIEVQQ